MYFGNESFVDSIVSKCSLPAPLLSFLSMVSFAGQKLLSLVVCVPSVVQSCSSLCDLMDCSPPGSSLSVGFPRKEYWSGLPFPFPGGLPNPSIEPEALLQLLHRQADSVFISITLGDECPPPPNHCDLCQSVLPMFSSREFIISGLNI